MSTDHGAAPATKPRDDDAPMEFDPYSDSFFADPYETYRWMRDEAPVYYSQRWDFHALTRYCTRQDGVRTYPVRAEFERQGLGETDQAPLAGRIGTPIRIAETSRRRRHVDDGRRLGFLQMRNCQPRDIEGAMKIDLHHGLPVVRVQIRHRPGRSGDSGVVDQDIQTTPSGLGGVDRGFGCAGLRQVGYHHIDLGGA